VLNSLLNILQRLSATFQESKSSAIRVIYTAAILSRALPASVVFLLRSSLLCSLYTCCSSYQRSLRHNLVHLHNFSRSLSLVNVHTHRKCQLVATNSACITSMSWICLPLQLVYVHFCSLAQQEKAGAGESIVFWRLCRAAHTR
jgi:hypothetical protein